MPAQPVELFQGFYWDCPACRTRNWTEGRQVPPDVAERAIRDELGLEEDEELPEGDDDPSDMVMVPDEVSCQKCGKVFPVKEDEEPEEE